MKENDITTDEDIEEDDSVTEELNMSEEELVSPKGKEVVLSAVKKHRNTREFLFIGGPLHGKFRVVDQDYDWYQVNDVTGEFTDDTILKERPGITTYVKRNMTLNSMFTGAKAFQFFCFNKMSEVDARYYFDKMQKLITTAM